MSDRLEEFIKNHKEAFDDREPSDQLWVSIEKELENDTRKVVPAWPWVWKVAAVFFFVTSAWLVADKLLRHGGPLGEEELAMTDEYRDFVEADRYYTTLISQKKQEIEDFRLANSNLEEEFLNDVDKLDSMYIELKNELKTFQYNEKLMDAVIRNLQLRVEILNQQISLLQRIKQKREQEASVSI